MVEVVIPNPDWNIDPFSSHSQEHAIYGDVLAKTLAIRSITFQTHPVAVDLCSGDAAIARMLVEKGWNAKNLTCIDWTKCYSPLVSGVNWVYWDLKELGITLKYGSPLPGSVSSYLHKFDLVTLFNGFLGREIEQLICDFLVKPKGDIIAASFFENIL